MMRYDFVSANPDPREIPAQVFVTNTMRYRCGNTIAGYPPGSYDTCEICLSVGVHNPGDRHDERANRCLCTECGHCHFMHEKA